MHDAEDIAQKLRTALRRLPGPVCIITTHDEATDAPVGMVASAVIPVSMAPPSMMVAVNRSAYCHGAISSSKRFCINLLSTKQSALVPLFSDPSRREERFREGGWDFADKLPYLKDALVSIFCSLENGLVHGSHEMFVGNCFDVLCTGAEQDFTEMGPLGWVEGGFARFDAL